MNKIVFVSGCFDTLHSGHITFLHNAAKHGDLYVSIGSDKTITQLKGKPIYNEGERLLIVSSLSCVRQAYIGSGDGSLDFVNELDLVKPHIFIVNSDGDFEEKKMLCLNRGIEYKVLERIPYKGMPVRFSSQEKVSYRIDLAGGWLDQPYISKLQSGMVVNISVRPTILFDRYSGMATSTRNVAIELWGGTLSSRDEKTARLLFGAENPPGKTVITGSQDAYGICLAGLKFLHYDNSYLPKQIEIIDDGDILKWLESLIYLIPLGQREKDFDIFEGATFQVSGAKKLAAASDLCKDAILKGDEEQLGMSVTNSFVAQSELFPLTRNDHVDNVIDHYKDSVFGYKLAGAGGGGYLILISEKEIEGAIKIKIL